MAKVNTDHCDNAASMEQEKFRKDDVTGEKFVAVTDQAALDKLCEINDNLSGGLCSKVASETISAMQLVRLTNPTDVQIADTSTCPDATVFGVARVAANAATNIEIQRSGKLYDSSFNFAVNTPLFLSATGSITDVAPTTGFLTQIGYAGGPGLIIIEINDPVEL